MKTIKTAAFGRNIIVSEHFETPLSLTVTRLATLTAAQAEELASDLLYRARLVREQSGI